MLKTLTGYWPRSCLLFNGDENNYELWEGKFLGCMTLQKLNEVILDCNNENYTEKNAKAFAELVQSMDDRSLLLVICDAKTTAIEKH